MADQERLKSFDAYFKIDGIEGESQDDKHKNEIEVLSFESRVDNKGSADAGGGMGSGVSQHGAFTFKHYVDKATAKLFVASCNGEHIKKAVLTLRKAGKEQRDFLIVTLSDVMVKTVRPSTMNRDNRMAVDTFPTETVSLHYGKIEHTYMEQKSDGTTGGQIKSGWDVKARKST